MPRWCYLAGVLWAAVLAYTLGEAAFGQDGLAAVPLVPVTAVTVLWSVLIGVYRAWPLWCLTVVTAGAVFTVLAVLAVRSGQQPAGQHFVDRGAIVGFLVAALPAPFGALVTVQAGAAAIGALASVLWRRVLWRRGSPTGTRARIGWLTAGGSAWAVAVAVGVAGGLDPAGLLWEPGEPMAVPVLLLVALTVGWGAVIGGLREWAEVPAALGLAGVAATIGIVAAGTIGRGGWVDLWGWDGQLATVAAAFGLVALALSLGVVAGSGWRMAAGVAVRHQPRGARA